MEQPPAAAAAALVGDLARLLVPEVVARRRPRRGCRDRELLERGHRLLVAAPAHVAHRLELERAREHRRRGEHLGGQLTARCDPRLEHLAHAGRKRPLLAACRRGRRDTRRRRTASRASPRRAGRRAPPAPRPPRPARRPRRARAATAPRRRPIPCRGGLGEHAPRRMGGRRLLGLPGEHEQGRVAAQPAGEVGERLERGRVGPVDVVDEHDGRLLAGRRREQRAARSPSKNRACAPGSVERRGRRRFRARARAARPRLPPPARPRPRHPRAAPRARARSRSRTRARPRARSSGRRRATAAPAPRAQPSSSSPRRVFPIPASPSIDDELPVRPDRAVSGEQRLPLPLPADERDARRAGRRRLGPAAGSPAGLRRPSRTEW